MVKVKRLIAECHADLRYDRRRAKVAAARNVLGTNFRLIADGFATYEKNL